jgi:hypothetical protein
MYELRNCYHDTITVKRRALIGLELYRKVTPVSKRLTFETILNLVEIIYNFKILLLVSLLAFI